MKKFIIALLAFVAFVTTSFAQSKQTLTLTGVGDSIVNAGTKYLSTPLDGNVVAATIHVIFTKTSGTAAGKATIEYSTDGTNYYRVNTDSLNITNVTTQGKLWTIPTPSAYPYVRIKIVGSGTSRYKFSTATIYIRKP